MLDVNMIIANNIQAELKKENLIAHQTDGYVPTMNPSNNQNIYNQELFVGRD